MRRKEFAILALIGALTDPCAGASPVLRSGVAQSVSPARPEARLAAARSAAAAMSMKTLANAVRAFRMDTGRYPSNGEGLLVLIERPLGVRGWRGPYVATSSWQPGTLDPWGNGYRYRNTTAPGGRAAFAIMSNGPDGVSATADDLRIDG